MAEKLFKNDPPKPPSPSPIWSKGDSLGTKVEKLFTRVLQNAVTSMWEWGAELMVHIFDASMKILKPGMLRMFTPVLNEVEKMPGLPPYIKTMIANVKDEKGEAGAIGVGLFAVAALYQLLGGLLQPIVNLTTQGVNKLIPNVLPDPLTAAAANLRGLYTDAEYDGVMNNHGYGDRDISVMRSMAQRFPTIFEGIEFVRRGLYVKPDFMLLAKRLGIDETHANMYYDMVQAIPPLQDLIRFQVREAFNDAVSSKFGYDEGYPTEIDPFLKRLGYGPDTGKRYWRAHWQLPSPSQAYEMLHRGLIDQATLSELLKTSDYPEFWRDKLEKISYNTLTRVDVRRMLQAGVIDRSRALRAYKDMGYNDADAELMTQFAERGISQDEKDLTRSDIVGMYVDGLIDQGEVNSSLVKMGYDSVEADKILKQADFDIAKQARTDTINYIKEQYAANKIDKIAVQSQLNTAGIKDKAASRYILAWERAKQSEIKGLSLIDAKRLYKKGVINKDEFRAALVEMNYSDKVIALFMKEVEIDDSEEA